MALITLLWVFVTCRPVSSPFAREASKPTPSASRFCVSQRSCGAAHEQPGALKMQSQSATANTQVRGLVGPHTDVDI